MKYQDMIPVTTKATTRTSGGGGTSNPRAIGGEVKGIPVADDGHSLASVWKCKSLWYRVRFLFTGKVCLTVMGTKQVPVSLSIGPDVHA